MCVYVCVCVCVRVCVCVWCVRACVHVNLYYKQLQGYPSELLATVVQGIPSMHICIDFIPELLAHKDKAKQVGTQNSLLKF